MAMLDLFSLDMKDDVPVWELEELQENFSLKKVLVYIGDGRMDKWLRNDDRNSIADGIAALDKADGDYYRKLYALFGVEYNEAEVEEMTKEAERAEKLKKLRNYTGEPKYVDNVDYVAFEQNDLYDLLDDGATTIYLCGERFEIPLEKSGIAYIGVNKPTVVINSKNEVDWSSKGISLGGVKYDERYQAVIDAEAQRKKRVTWQEEFGLYIPSLLTLKTIENVYYIGVAKELTGLHFDCENNPIGNFTEMVKDLGDRLVRGIDDISLSNYPQSINFTSDKLSFYRNNKSAYTYYIKEDLKIIFPMAETNEYARVIMGNAVVFAASSKFHTVSRSGGGGFMSRVDGEYSLGFKGQIRKALGDYFVGRYGLDFSNNNFNLAGYMFIFWALMILTVDDSQKDKLSVICELASMMKLNGTEVREIIKILRLIYGEKINEPIISRYVKAVFVLILKEYGYTD